MHPRGRNKTDVGRCNSRILQNKPYGAQVVECYINEIEETDPHLVFTLLASSRE